MDGSPTAGSQGLRASDHALFRAPTGRSSREKVMRTNCLRRHVKAVFRRRQIAARFRERVFDGADPSIVDGNEVTLDRRR